MSPLNKNLGNAAFFSIKRIDKELEALKLEIEEVKKQVRDLRLQTVVEIKDPVQL